MRLSGEGEQTGRWSGGGKVRQELLAQEIAQEKHRPARERWLALSS
jgi:hypothetical protein